MRHSRWHRQDGFVRGTILIAVIIVVLAVLVLDSVSVVNASLGVRQNATDAADQALSTYVETENTGMAWPSAATFLKLHDSILLRQGSASSRRPWARAVDRHDHGGAQAPHLRLPLLPVAAMGIGPWIHKTLNPRATETNTATRAAAAAAPAPQSPRRHQSSSSTAGGCDRPSR